MVLLRNNMHVHMWMLVMRDSYNKHILTIQVLGGGEGGGGGGEARSHVLEAVSYKTCYPM